MKIEHLFFVIGIIFLFATIVYFSYEYVFNLPDSIKAVILVCLTIASFFIADFLAEREI